MGNYHDDNYTNHNLRREIEKRELEIRLKELNPPEKYVMPDLLKAWYAIIILVLLALGFIFN